MNKDADIEECCQEFESLFVYQMLKSARRAKLAEVYFLIKVTKLINLFRPRVFKNIIQKS